MTQPPKRRRRSYVAMLDEQRMVDRLYMLLAEENELFVFAKYL